MTVQQIVQILDLKPHPEGGFYKEVYRSEGTIEKACLPENFGGKRNFSTSIYYLLQKGDFSAFHRIKSDEIWHFYGGGSLLIHVLHPDGSYECRVLGNLIESGATFQAVVPAGSWFASEPALGNEFTLAGCTVAPGFDFTDFELADPKNLVQLYTSYEELITRLCR